jgi:hypothetical protein
MDRISWHGCSCIVGIPSKAMQAHRYIHETHLQSGFLAQRCCGNQGDFAAILVKFLRLPISAYPTRRQSCKRDSVKRKSHCSAHMIWQYKIVSEVSKAYRLYRKRATPGAVTPQNAKYISLIHPIPQVPVVYGRYLQFLLMSFSPSWILVHEKKVFLPQVDYVPLNEDWFNKSGHLQ